MQSCPSKGDVKPLWVATLLLVSMIWILLCRKKCFNAADLKNVSKHMRLSLPGSQVGRRKFWSGELAEQLARFIHLDLIETIIGKPFLSKIYDFLEIF